MTKRPYLFLQMFVRGPNNSWTLCTEMPMDKYMLPLSDPTFFEEADKQYVFALTDESQRHLKPDTRAVTNKAFRPVCGFEATNVHFEKITWLEAENGDDIIVFLFKSQCGRRSGIHFRRTDKMTENDPTRLDF